jgi:hypothetical protein
MRDDPEMQPAAATRPARAPRATPAEIVSSAPVPGVATMTNAVIRKVGRMTSDAVSPAPPGGPRCDLAQGTGREFVGPPAAHSVKVTIDACLRILRCSDTVD